MTVDKSDKKSAQLNREWNYDLLRVFAIFQVVLQHIAYRYAGTFALSCFAFSKTTIPLFVMLSGAFIITDDKNGDYRLFFRTKTKKLIIATLVWSIIYVIYSYIILLFKNGEPVSLHTLVLPLRKWAAGSPFYHLWFLYMFVGIYAVAPVFIWIKEKAGEKNFAIASVVVALLMIPAGMFSNLIWIIKFVPYLGYFMLGYTIRNYFTRKINGALLITATTFILSLTVYLIWSKPEWLPYKISSELLSYQSVTIFIAAVCLFKFFGQLRISGSKWLYKLSKHSFNVYLLHALVISLIGLVIPYEILKSSPAVMIPLITFFVLCFCYVVSIFFIRRRML
jgi:surface polysaccharide O-acyltransferase-like enzyme